jgi:threonine/homoserine/homoserine lactone efflux protein
MKVLIMNAIWIPIHLAWLWAGVALHRLDLPQQIQRRINIAMAGCMLAVVALAIWSAVRGMS